MKIVNLFTISPHGEAVNYRPCACPSFEVAKPCKITAISTIVIYISLSKCPSQIFLGKGLTLTAAPGLSFIQLTLLPFPSRGD